MTARQPPHDLPAEESLLGAMLLSTDAIDVAVDLARADWFYKPVHGHIYTAICDLHTLGADVDPVTVADHLNRLGLLDTIGGPPALLSLVSNVPATTSIATYCQIVRDHHQLRQLAGTGAQITERAYEGAIDVGDTLAWAEQQITAIGDGPTTSHATPVGEGLDAWVDRMEVRIESGTGGVPSGWKDLDEMLQGFRPGQVITLAARPGMGKSAAALLIALHAAREGHPALFCSLEMSREELDDRVMAAEARINLQAIRSANLYDRDWSRISQALGRLGDMPLYIDADSTITPGRLRSRVRRMKARHGISLVVVDYIQLMDADGRAENRQLEVSAISRGLKKLALDLEVPVISLAQLNRQLEARRDKRPQLADLRESGSIENDSDVVLFLYREDYYNPTSADAGICEVIIAKQRNGPTGTVRLAWLAPYGQLADMVRAV